jgi:beta-lactamase regulating signal transducer with metallopeptidase domain/protocatechuate 3,4-dioxygenase beta subunit/tetratricopeptide (TPR) repeat protein
MSQAFESYAVWLADFYLLTAVLLGLAMTGCAVLKQPAQRLAVGKSALVGLLLLGVLSAIPGWSAIHLLTAQKPLAALPAVERAAPVVRTALPSAEVRAPMTTAEPANANSTKPMLPDEKASTPIQWELVLSALHVCGAVVVFGWLVLGWFASRALRRSARPAPPWVRALLGELSSSRGHLARAEVCTSERIDVAVALGVWRPVILVPERWCSEPALATESPERPNSSLQGRGNLRPVMAHELAHVANRDLHWVAFARVLLVALWAHPLFWFMRRRLRLDQEALADAAAAEVAGRQAYAEQLVAWGREASRRPVMQLPSAVGLWEGPSQLRRRVAMLLNERLTVLRSCSRRWRFGSAVVVVGVAAVLSLVTTRPAMTQAKSKDQALAEDKSDVTGTFFQTSTPPGVPNIIAGQCVDENEKPLAGADVLLARATWDGTSRKNISRQTTASDGRFRFEHVVDIQREYPNGKIPKFPNPAIPTFQISARKAGRESCSEIVDQNQIANFGANMHVPMGPGATLRGRVTNSNGEPVAGALVSVGFSQLDRWEGFQTARTRADGTYEITDAPPLQVSDKKPGPPDELRSGSYSLVTRASTQPIIVTQTDYADRSVRCKGIPGTQDIQLEPAAIIRGRVIDATTNKPAANIRVIAVPVYAYATTDDHGAYRFHSLPAGTYNLWSVTPDRVNKDAPKVKTSTERETTAPDLVLTAGGTVRIRLIDDKTGQPVPLHGDEYAQVHVEPSAPLIGSGYLAAKDGRFEVQVIPGDVKVDSIAASSNGNIRWLIRPGDRPAAHVEDGQATEVDVRVIEYDPEREQKVAGLFHRAISSQRAAEDRKAVAIYEEVIKLDPAYPNNVAAYNELARLLAMSSDDTVRDGKRATEIAEKAQQLQNHPDPQILDTLAAAYAEFGNFAKAIEIQNNAIDLATKQKQDKTSHIPQKDFETQDKAFRAHLKLYESRQPRRKPAKATGTSLVLPMEGSKKGGGRNKADSRTDKKAPASAKNGAAKQSHVEIPVIVAKHVLLLDGKEIITWDELEAKIAALGNPSLAFPEFYVTNGAMESGVEKDAKPRMYELHRKYKLQGHSEGTLSARTSMRYDAIHGKADLTPDESLRVDGTVVDSQNKPVTGAEVVLITPVPESLAYKSYDIALVKGRLRNRLDDVVTDTDAAGRFAVYPPKGSKYYVLALHPDVGINIARGESLAHDSKVHLLSWAELTTELAPEPAAKQTASISTRFRGEDGYPEVSLAQYWSDLKDTKPTNVFGFTHVPPIMETSIQRDIAEPDGGSMGLNSASVSLLPGDSRRIDLGKMTDKEREYLKSLSEMLDEHRKPRGENAGAATETTAGKKK